MWNMPFCICGVTVKTLKGKKSTIVVGELGTSLATR
jgi:hypothetical protein